MAAASQLNMASDAQLEASEILLETEIACDDVVASKTDPKAGTEENKDDSKKEESRVIFINAPQPQAFCNNKIFTAKYNAASFVPKFLLMQFKIYANCFFLFITCLQQIPDVSPMGRLNTIVPFGIMMTVSLLKEVSQDLKRHKGDRETNQRMIKVQRDKKWTEVMWQDVTVGELVRVDSGCPFPCDLVLLSSSEPTGMCYIDTQNLDGETNLKLRQALKETAHIVTGESLGALKALIECELPNRHLYDFSGTIKLTDQAPSAKSTRSGQLLMKMSKTIAAKTKSQVAAFQNNAQKALPLGPDQVLLRGSTLKNTDWIYGVSIYTGKESKLMLNSTSSPLKQTRMERTTNYQILYLMIVLLIMATSCTIMNKLWTDKNAEIHWYLYFDYGETHSVFFNFLTFIVLYSNFIPISVQVTLEMVKFQQAIFINWDKDMYYPRTDTPANARTSNLNEELGQIKYLFSDKTGTLTQNIMTFRKCTIAGTQYADKVEGEDFEGAGVVKALRALEKLCTALREADPEDPTELDILERKEHERDVVAEYLILLGVCHTVIPQLDEETKKIAYLASSPDEAALVSAAATMQHVFTSRTPTSCCVTELGVKKTYQILNVLEFTSKRKRMSVVVKTPEGKIKLYCKGADNVILERLGNNQFVDVTLGHLATYAAVGLRTLCLSYVDISPEFYEDWAHTFYLASTALKDREIKLEDAAELIETNLTLLGATAIEDKLQDGVPETIHTLAQADIKIWILTGDKQETAINIGFSCKLLTHNMDLVIVNEETLEATKKCLEKHKEAFGDMLGKDNLAALIIDGQSLRHAYNPICQSDFLAIAMSCKAVVCCRVSPLQKAEIVELVKNSQDAVTLAIGDGANDVGMIQAAHVGIGISGEEGLQAASASDYSIGQFRFLQKLLLVHGAWSYSRIAKMVLYCFYKNVVLYLTQFWFQLYNGFSGQILYEKWTISLYNLCFTSIPPLAMGMFDRYCSMDTMMNNPLLYKDSQTGKLFNNTVFWTWIINAIFHSVAIWSMTSMMLRSGVVWADGQGIDSFFLGNCCYTYAVVTTCLKAAIETTAWTWYSHFAIWGSIICWGVFVPIYSYLFQIVRVAPEFAGLGMALARCPTFWLGMLLIPTTCLIRDVAWKVIKRDVFKTHRHAIQEMEKAHKNVDLSASIQKKYSTKDTRPNFDRRRVSTAASSRKSLGYAFAQEENGAMSQEKVIRSYDTNKNKPSGK